MQPVPKEQLLRQRAQLVRRAERLNGQWAVAEHRWRRQLRRLSHTDIGREELERRRERWAEQSERWAYRLAELERQLVELDHRLDRLDHPPNLSAAA